MSLKTSNASCPIGFRYKDLLKLQSSQFDRMVTKTCTLEAIRGPKYPYYKSTKLYSINNFGLKNPGYKTYAFYKFPNKPLTISVTGSFSELKQIVSIPTNAHRLEFNISCPNSSRRISVKELAKLDHVLPFGIKLPPYFDLHDIEVMAKELKQLEYHRKLFSYIVCCNTIPSDSGGMGGPLLKPVSLYNIEYFRKLLPKSINIWGCGGIREVDDLIEYELAGSYGVQMGTIVLDKGLEYTDDLIRMYNSVEN